jgi:putative oxidoreductase
MIKIREWILSVTSKFSWLPGLLSRIAVGLVFIQSGWGKLHHLDKVIQFFSSLGIPAPQLQAPFVAGVELVGGSLVLLGLFTRVAAVPLIGTMVVAILTAKRADIHELGDLFFMPEYLFILLLLWLIIKGAGAVSVDKVLTKTEKEST